jgi:cytochrome P450
LTYIDRLGGGIFSVDGKQWEHARSLLRPQFAREQVSDLELEERHLQNMLLALPAHADGWTDFVDLLPLNFRLTMDSASEFLFGESVNSQLAALPCGADVSSTRLEDAAFVSAFELSQDIIAKAFRFNDWYSIGLTKEYYEACKVCHRYIDRFVQKGLGHGKKRLESNGRAKYVFLDALVAETRDPVEIRDQLLSILVAGRDTTASLLSFLFLVLSQNEHIFQKLRQTIVKDFGTFEAPKNITFSNLKACSYLQWCLNETLRLYPTVPMNSRRSIVDTTLPRGGGADGLSPVFVPRGTEVNYSVYATHRNEVLWGKDANEFKPDRWDGRKPGFEYLPFNGGPR